MKLNKQNTDKGYECVMQPQPGQLLESKTYEITIDGTHVKIPGGSELFIVKDGSVFIVMSKEGDTREYFSIQEFAKEVNSAIMIQGFSE